MDILTLFEQFFSTFWNTLLELFYHPFVWVLNGIILVIGYVVFYIYSGFLTVIMTFLEVFNMFGSFEILVAELVGLPPAMLYLMNQSGFVYAINIVFAAYAIRFTMNLIPGAFTRV